MRAVALVALFVGQLYAWRMYDGEESGANIGAGLIAFAVTAVVSGVWAGYDAGRRPTSLVLRTWVGVAVVFGLASSLPPGLGGEAFDWTVWRSDLVFLALFDFVLVFAPAMVSALVVGSAGDQKPA